MSENLSGIKITLGAWIKDRGKEWGDDELILSVPVNLTVGLVKQWIEAISRLEERNAAAQAKIEYLEAVIKTLKEGKS